MLTNNNIYISVYITYGIIIAKIKLGAKILSCEAIAEIK